MATLINAITFVHRIVTIHRSIIICRVLAYDPEQLQFVADIRTTERDPGAIYVLSSRFHRYFLKNLNPGEPNVRIMRLNELHHDEIAAASGRLNAPASLPSNAINFKHQHQFTLGSPVANKAPILRTSATLAPVYGNSLPPSFYAQPGAPINRQQQQPAPALGPYRFEQVGIINKAVQNPFTALNTGERPDGGHHAFTTLRRGKFGTIAGGGGFDEATLQLYDQQQPTASFVYNPVQHQHHDFNGLRFAKNAHFNASSTN